MGIFRGSALLVGLLVPLALSGQSRADEGVPEAKRRARVASVANAVASLRGLALAPQMEIAIVTRDQLVSRLRQTFEETRQEAELLAEEVALRRLGVLSDSTDYAAQQAALLQEPSGGYYDLRAAQLAVSGEDLDGHLAHELTHALQDSHFDIEALLAVDRGNLDSMRARQALIEGDGIALMLEYTLAEVGQAPPWGSARVVGQLVAKLRASVGDRVLPSEALREQLLFPYLAGLQFIAHARKHNSWKAINAMYARPPLSTEHILHPKKYEAYELPTVIAAARPSALAGYSEVFATVMGEQGVLTFLQAHGLSAARASGAAAGWGGDTFAVYSPSNRRGVTANDSIGVWFLSWDTEIDASEFFDGLEHALPTITAGVGKTVRDVQRYAGTRTSAVAERRGAEVVLVIGATQVGGDAIRGDIWRRWTRN